MRKGLLSLLLMMLITICFSVNVRAATCPREQCGTTLVEVYDVTTDSLHIGHYSCSNCGYTSLTGSVQGNHTFGSWTSNGYGVSHSRTCSKCNYKQTESHSYGVWKKANDSQHRRDCSKCNSYGLENHTATSAATCTSSAYCGSCGAYYGNALGHSWGDYEANGSSGHRRKCTRCGTYEATVDHVNFELGLALNDGENYHSKNCYVCKYEINRKKNKWVVDVAGVYTDGK